MLLLAGCASQPPGPGGDTPARSTAQLLDTYWKLTQLGDRVVTTPQDAREIHLVLHTQNQRVAGFSGCNQMMGAYVLNGGALKFDQMGGTLMACTANMELEREFLRMFDQVAAWKIDGETLQLLDDGGKPLATFESRYTK
jgi:heat shock protein HslJ